jgi:hypothetical protein
MFGSTTGHISSDDRSGPFNWSEWRQLRRVLEAGAAADTGRFKTELQALDRKFPMSGRAGAYLWFALRYQVAKTLDRKPISSDLFPMARDAYPRFNGLVSVDMGVLDDLLHVVFEMRRSTESTTGANLIVNGAAALSVLVTDPSELDEMETHLVLWYNRNGGDFMALDPLGT